MENQLTTICEFGKCRKKCTQADTYMNMWFCDDHYSKVGFLMDDYQSGGVHDITAEKIDNLDTQLTFIKICFTK